MSVPAGTAGAAAAPGPPVTGSLADVLPAVAAALGCPLRPGPWTLPDARAVCVLMVDGLGERLLAARGGHAPALRALAAASSARVLSVGHPSTTATSMGTFGTGLEPGQHGLVGYQVRDPATGTLLNELSWADGPDPRRWQPLPTVFEHAAAAGVAVTRIGAPHFDGSGLTEAALRGGRFVGATSPAARVRAAVAALRSGQGNRQGSSGQGSGQRGSQRSLVYLYWGEVDKVGHTSGWGSPAWAQALEAVDAAVADLLAQLPRGALLVVTADHGMVDVPREARWDLAVDAELAAGVALTGGEPRAPMLYCTPGAAGDVLATWRGRLGEQVDVLSRDEAIEAGWFGPVDDRILPRLGEVVAAARAPVSVHDSRVQRAALGDLIGMHGARTPEEVRVPLLLASG